MTGSKNLGPRSNLTAQTLVLGPAVDINNISPQELINGKINGSRPKVTYGGHGWEDYKLW